MSKKPTLSDIARKTGVSITTVSFVLNNRTDVTLPDRTRQNVLKAAEEIGYQPNQIARALVTGKSALIGVWQAVLGGPFHSMVLRHLQNMLRLDGYAVMIGDAIAGKKNDEIYDLGVFSRWAVDGLITIDGPDHIERYLKSAGSSPLPMVSIGSFPCKLTDYVFIDMKKACMQTLQHLYDQGCRSIVFVINQWGVMNEGERGKAYDEFTAQCGIKSTRILGDPVYQMESTREKVKEYISERGAPDAFYCFSDEIAIGAYKGVRDLGLRIPDDVAITGCDGIEVTKYIDQPITTIVQPVEQMCSIAWEFLRKRMNDPKMPQQSAVIDGVLDIRASSTKS